MTRKLHLHVGAPKTGSSALQLYFQTNIKALADRGIRYPPGATINLAMGLATGNGRYYTDGEDTKWQRKPTYTQLAGRKDRDILISSEAFGELRIPEISALAAYCKRQSIELVPFLFVRDAGAWYRAAYQQYLKRPGLPQQAQSKPGGTQSFPEYIEMVSHHRYLPALTVARYETALPEGTLRVFSYEAAAGDIVTYTMRRVFGIEPPGEWANPIMNRSLTKDEVDHLIQTNRAGGDGYAYSDALLADHRVIPGELRFAEPLPDWFATQIQPDIDYLQTKLTPPETVFVHSAERAATLLAPEGTAD